MKILFYTRNNLTEWSKFLVNNLKSPSKILVVSEINGIGDYSLQDEYYKNVHLERSRLYAIEEFGESTCFEIITRCRLLKNLDEDLALRMIGAMLQSVEKILDSFQPDIFLSLRVDSYVLDIFSKILKRRGIKYLGLWKAALLEDHFFFTTSGEYFSLESIDEAKVEIVYDQITSESFKATSIVSTNQFSLGRFMRNWLYYFIRDITLFYYSRLISDIYGYRYMTTGRNVPEYNVKLSNWKVNKFINKNWKAVFEASNLDKTLFIGLQVNPESTIDYYVKDMELSDYRKVLPLIIQSFLDKGFKIFIKDHPNMFGMRNFEFIDRLVSNENVILVPYTASSNFLIKNCTATFTWTGTIGLQSALAGKCSIVVEPTYFLEGYFLLLDDVNKIKDLPDLVENYQSKINSPEEGKELLKHALNTYLPGKMQPLKFDSKDAELASGTMKMIETLDKILPTL